MPTGLKTIHGFQRDRQTGNFPFLREEIRETLLVECHSALDTVFDLQDSLPAFGSGASGNMPDGTTITFSLHISSHPHRARLILLDASNVRRDKDHGSFWLIDLRYGALDNPDRTVTGAENPQTVPEPIVYPWQKPPVWSSSSKLVDHFTFRKPNGDYIRHTNGLILNEAYRVPVAHETYTFMFYTPYGSFNPEYIRQYIGGANKTILWGGLPGTWKLVGKSENEEWTQLFNNNQKQNVRSIVTRLTFEWNPEGWEDIRVSMSTKQLVDGQLVSIPIDDEGNVARSPWPLLDDGSAAPYDPAEFDPAEFATLNTGWNFTNQIQPDIRELALVFKLNAGGVSP